MPVIFRVTVIAVVSCDVLVDLVQTQAVLFGGRDGLDNKVQVTIRRSSAT